ncbi:AAA family ATPase [Amycolatopsis azurea]|uniref:helix-turn-helix transcriptional regulator n=1 Tax=Amycolatopsis azurea TaxID=36819 RepID=UPI003819DE02
MLGGRTTVLIERGNEMKFLENLFSETDSGNGRIALVNGAVASGKTELLRTFAEQRASEGAVVLTMTGDRDRETRAYGSLQRLVRDLPVPRAKTLELTRLIARSSDGVPPSSFDVANIVLELMLELAERTPLLITVDDAQHVDASSMDCLLRLSERTRSARIMLLLAELAHGRSAHPSYRIELVRQLHFRRLGLAPLSAAGVAKLLARHLDPDAAERLAAGCYTITRGNPLLVRALIEDQLDWPEPGQDARPVVGDAFRHAVLTCLRRGGSDVLALARVVSVLGPDSTVERLSRLVHRRPADVARALKALRTVGFLNGNDFRDRSFREAVIDCMEPEDLAKLHMTAARALHADKAGAGRVAHHLLAAGSNPDAWAVEQLHSAAKEALRADDAGRAAEYLEHALTGQPDGPHAAALRVLLLRAELRGGSVADRHLTRLCEHERAGDLDPEQKVFLVQRLLWAGRQQDAEPVLDRLGREYARRRSLNSTVADVGHWLRHTHPALAPRWAEATGAAAREDAEPAWWAASASEALITVLGGTDEHGAVSTAESLLEATPLDDLTVGPMAAALHTLIYADRLENATNWCDALLEEAKARGVAWWQAVFSACRADIALRYGELSKASGYAHDAIEAVGAERWGVAIGMPLAVLIRVATVIGDHETVREHLRQPVPEEMYRSGYCLPYLRARGRYCLANGRVEAALADFERCRELMTAWGFEAPTLAPWRTDSARAHLRLGDADRARELASRQLAHPRFRTPRVRGAALRMLAATEDVNSRLAMLKETVEVLNASGDRLELAQALFDLSRTHQAMKQFAKARMVLLRARRLGQACRLEMTPPRGSEEPRPESGAEWTAPEQAAAAAPAADASDSSESSGVAAAAVQNDQILRILTSSEYRVATLASFGYTNQEISTKLHVTPSTVEQHLTRVFRKLKVSKRTDLPVDLQLEAAQAGGMRTAGKSRVSGRGSRSDTP